MYVSYGINVVTGETKVFHTPDEKWHILYESEDCSHWLPISEREYERIQLAISFAAQKAPAQAG